jgi:hypothetical protein
MQHGDINCQKNIQRVQFVIDDTIIEEGTDFIYLANMISEFRQILPQKHKGIIK